jgi:hypothetical protein
MEALRQAENLSRIVSPFSGLPLTGAFKLGKVAKPCSESRPDLSLAHELGSVSKCISPRAVVRKEKNGPKLSFTRAGQTSREIFPAGHRPT